MDDTGAMLSEQDRASLNTAGAMYLRDYAYDLPIYQWMKDHHIGESTYGSFMDKSGLGQGLFHHRHFGHHVIYDFPLGDIHNAPDFLDHLLVSDFFTKQGIPIIPGEFLNSPAIREFCSGKTLDWNFVNAFDLLSGTLAIYAGYRNIKTYWHGEQSIESFAELAKQLGIGTLELAIAVSTKNPFLLFGAILHLAGATKGVLTSPSKAYFRKILGQYVLIIAPDELTIEKCWNEYELSVKNVWNGYSPQESWPSYDLKA